MSKVSKQYKFEPDYAVPPGYTLDEVIQSLNMTQRDFAIRVGLSVVSVSRIINDEQPISYETANRFELVTGVPARMWNNLESQYREQLAKREEREHLKQDLDWLKNIPVKELIDRSVISDATDRVELLRSVLEFYGVTDVAAWRKVWDTPEVAARRSPCFETHIGSASTWIRLGELESRKVICQPFDKERFKQKLKKIRELTVVKDECFFVSLQQYCADSGVAVVLVPEMRKVPWFGATKWLTSDKAMIILNLRGKQEDKFWFSFFHEASHILHDPKKRLYINDDKCRDDHFEQRADHFAAEQLIPARYNTQIKVARSHEDIVELARRLGISPGIVAGRYQYITKRWGWFSKLIRRFEWKG